MNEILKEFNEVNITVDGVNAIPYEHSLNTVLLIQEITDDVGTNLIVSLQKFKETIIKKEGKFKTK